MIGIGFVQMLRHFRSGTWPPTGTWEEGPGANPSPMQRATSFPVSVSTPLACHVVDKLVLGGLDSFEEQQARS